jgi:hypothetical protein
MHILLTDTKDGGRQLDIDMPLGNGLIKIDSTGRLIHYQFRPTDPYEYEVNQRLKAKQSKLLEGSSFDNMPLPNNTKAHTPVISPKTNEPITFVDNSNYTPRFELPGDKLAKAFESVGIKPTEGCSCKSHQKKMNELWMALEKQNPTATQSQLNLMYVNKYGLTIAKWLTAEAFKQKVIITPGQILKVTKEVMGYKDTSLLGFLSPKKLWAKISGKSKEQERPSISEFDSSTNK